MEDNRVLLYQDENEKFELYNGAGQFVEGDFSSEDEASQWCKDNRLELVDIYYARLTDEL